MNPRTKPTLLMRSFAWALAIAVLMTAVSFMPGARDVVSDPASGQILWVSVGFVFLSWFVAAELVMLIGGGLYFGASWLLRGANRRR
jgi:hypothetical protein